MGNSKTKLQILSYEEAEKKVTSKELNRLKIAFNQNEKNGLFSWERFHYELFGSFLPVSISETIFKSLKIQSNSNGITFKEYLIFLVILTKGNHEDICKLIFNIYCNESGTGVDYMDLQRSADTSNYRDEIKSARKYMNENQVITQENFMIWINHHPFFNQLSEWLLGATYNNNDININMNYPRLHLTDDTGPPDLYQLVAGITHLSEKEIIDLEKTYRRLLNKPPNKLDLEHFNQLTSPPIPSKIIPDIFRIFDEDGDGIVDIKELACGVSACTRGPISERQKFCCKIFDCDCDGYLDLDDFSRLYEICLQCRLSYSEIDSWAKNGSVKFRNLIKLADLENDKKISIDELMIWLNENDFIDPLLNLLNEVCVIVFGLRPQTHAEEIQIISSWIEREENLLFSSSASIESVSIISADWWNQWVTSSQILESSSAYSSSNNLNVNGNISVKQMKALRNTNHSRSMNNLFMPNKKQYDLHRSRSSKDKGGLESVSGRYIRKDCNSSSLLNPDESLNDRVFPWIDSQNDSRRIHNVADSSYYSSNNMFQSNNDSTVQVISKFSTPITNKSLLTNTINQKIPPNVSNLSQPDPTDPTSNNEYWCLKPDLRLHYDYLIIPDRIWTCLSTWYSGGPSITRAAWLIPINESTISTTNSDSSLLIYHKYNSQYYIVELNLLNLLVAVHTSPNNNQSSQNNPNNLNGSVSFVTNLSSSMLSYVSSSVSSIQQIRRQVKYRITISRKSTLSELLNQLGNKLKLSVDSIRIWRMSTDDNLSISSTPSSASFVLLEDDDKPLYQFSFQNVDNILLEQRNLDLTWPEELSQLAKNKSLSNRKASMNKGVAGLSNMGNSCFFNSAIQCISNSCALTDYFQRGLHLQELNKNNNQGCNGLLAIKYGELINDIWSGSTSLIVPIKVKLALQKYTRQFSDRQQHDAQELLCAVLDGLHEDLNRVKQKPKYHELKDSDDRDDEEVANEAWKAHLNMNQSIIVDLFHGLLKSNVTCDACNNSSVRFDAFSILSLPIPIETKEDIDVIVFSADNTQSGITYTVTLPISDTSVANAIKQLSVKLKISPKAIVIAIIDILTQKIQKFLDGNEKLFKTKKYYAYYFETENQDEEDDTSFIYFVYYNRKLILKTNYILAQTRLVPEIFGDPLVRRIHRSLPGVTKHQQMNGDESSFSMTNRYLYQLLDPLIPNDLKTTSDFSNIIHDSQQHSSSKLNHAIDCDQMTQFQPFVLSKVDSSAQKCSRCHWSKFCYGCLIPINDSSFDDASSTNEAHYFAIDWAIATLHLKYYSQNSSIHNDQNKSTNTSVLFSKTLISTVPKEPLNVFDCVEHFVAKESLDKDTPYQCTKCKKPQTAHKKLDLWNLPPILIIHLKRFQYVNRKWQKSNRFVEFPSENLDLNKFVVRNMKSTMDNDENESKDEKLEQPKMESSQYRLFAVNCHLGNLQMGHYITYARNRHNDKWFLFNDSICREVRESEVLNSSAYLLFYQRIGFRWDNLLDDIMVNSSKNNQSTTENINPNILAATELAISNSDEDNNDPDFKKLCSIQ